MDQPGRDAEQFVAQAGGVRTAVLVDPRECLEQGREVPGEQRGPHPHRVHGLIARRELAQRGTELGLTDAVLDVGATPEPRLDLEDRLGVAGGVAGAVVGRDVGDDERDRVGVGRGAFQRECELVLVDGAPPPRTR